MDAHSAIDIIDESAARCLLRAAMESSKAAQACEAEAAAAAEQARVQSHAHAFPSTSIPGRGPGTDAAHSGNFDLGNSNASVNSRNNSSTSSSSSSNSSSIHKHGGGSESSVANSEAKRAQLTDWQSWVARHGWRGQTEFERQQLLEWFGATPEHPAPGSDGACLLSSQCLNLRGSSCWSGSEPPLSTLPQAQTVRACLLTAA
eukprot:1151913-Pelagomonas_calceolata.AAC.11